MKIPATRITVKKHSNSRQKMTRSAPPPRVSSRVSHSPDTPDALSISIDDIYKSAERERLNYSAASRRQNLEYAQSQFQFFRDTVTSSRPNTSASRYIYVNSPRKDTMTPISVWSEPVLSRPSSTLKSRELAEVDEYGEAEDDEDYDMSDHYLGVSVTVSPVSRDCCEIIGPQMCHECRKNRIRQVDRERSDAFFPTLQPSEENLTTTAIAKKYLPNMSYPEIEDKLARGEIAKPSFFKRKTEKSETKPKPVSRRVTIVEDKDKDLKKESGSRAVNKLKTTAMFFSNIRDLNHKIISGAADRAIGFNGSKQPAPSLKHMPSTTNLFPTFVSPRKMASDEGPKYKTFYAPPLIAKESQQVEPSFFAGQKRDYKLPDKLPDELVFVDKEGNTTKIDDKNQPELPPNQLVLAPKEATIVEEEESDAEPASSDKVDTPDDTEDEVS